MMEEERQRQLKDMMMSKQEPVPSGTLHQIYFFSQLFVYFLFNCLFTYYSGLCGDSLVALE